MSATSSEHLARLIAERHDDVRQKLDALIFAFSMQDPGQVQATNAQLLGALKGLSAVLSSQDQPAWLSALLSHSQHLETHKADRSAAKPILTTLLSAYQSAISHNWFPEVEVETEFDLDAIISNARANHKIDDLFARLISVLEALARCEDLDSVKARGDLERVIATLKRAKTGSFTAQITSWQFVRRLVPNLLTSYLKRSAVTGPAIEAFEQTANELDIAFGAAKDEISQKVVEAGRGFFKSDAIQALEAEQIQALPDLADQSTTAAHQPKRQLPPSKGV